VGSNGVRGAALVQAGVSHRTAGLDVRERVHVAAGETGPLATALAEQGIEALVLSTCNRTELFLAGDDADRLEALARETLAAHSGLGLEDVLAVRRDDEAALHLFRVAAGLDSMLPGEAQILGQVREAYEDAAQAGATGRVLSRVFEHALHAGKRVRHETGVGTLPAAIPAAAADLARRTVGDLAGKRILVIGAGKMGELAATSFLDRGAERIFVANHRLERAEALAARFGGEAVSFERMGEELERADVVLSSTRCPEVILHAADVEAALPARGGRPLLLVDIAVPRDLDPAIADLPGCLLYDLDALGPEAGDALAHQEGQVEAAEAIVADEAEGFAAWLRSLEAVPVVTALRRRADEIRARELAKAQPRLRELSEGERREVEAVTAKIVNELLHEPTVRVKEAASAGTVAYADALRELFALDEEPA
jgi:glutamyl-tRNA reductase